MVVLCFKTILTFKFSSRTKIKKQIIHTLPYKNFQAYLLLAGTSSVWIKLFSTKVACALFWCGIGSTAGGASTAWVRRKPNLWSITNDPSPQDLRWRADHLQEDLSLLTDEKIWIILPTCLSLLSCVGWWSVSLAGVPGPPSPLFFI